jgi:hypothetical protein
MDSVNSSYSLNYNKSIAVNFNLWEVHGKILKNNIYVTTGLGAEINNYRFDKNVKMLSDTTPTQVVVESGKDYVKSKLVTGYLNAPLYLTFNSGLEIHIVQQTRSERKWRSSKKS